MSLFIDRIEIFEDKQPNGRRIKQIDFKFPIVVGGEEGDSLIFPTLENECGMCMFVKKSELNIQFFYCIF